MNVTFRSPRRPDRPARPAADGRGRPAESPRLRSRLRQVARETILDAAETVFARHGTAGGRMEEVAERAGVSVGTLYNHFRDRRALLDALIADRRSRLLATVDTSVAHAGGAFPGRLQAFVAALFEHVQTHRGLTAVLLREGQLGAAHAGAPSPDALQARAAALLREGLRSGALRRESAHTLAPALMALVRARLTADLAGTRRFARGTSARWVTQFFLQGAERR